MSRVSPRGPLITRGLAASCLVLLPFAATPALAQQVTGAEVRAAVEAGKQYLLGKQQPDGTWPDYNYSGGTTALATLALLNADVPHNSNAMQRALEAVRNVPLQYTYVVSLKAQALATGDPARYRTETRTAAHWLVQAQRTTGMWSYELQGGREDFSNSQFALLGLHEAANAGIEIPGPVWRKAEMAWIHAQAGNGGWAYMPRDPRITGSMTTAALASLYITGHVLETRQEQGFTPQGQAPGCGRYAEFRPIARGLNWLAKNFTARENPGRGSWYYYYLYGVERVGILSGLRYFGPHDWYRAGAARLVALQRADGSWNEINPVVDTAFALLFLAKGRHPVLVSKLQWSQDNAWNLDRNDLAHLVASIGDRLGEPVTWQVVNLEAGVPEWLTAPLLYFNGHQFPSLYDQAVAKLKEYVEQGGNILAEACCGRQEFRDGFLAFVRKAFPEYELHRLPQEHPVFGVLFKLKAAEVELYGLDLGCRTSVFYSPNDLSCLWEQGNVPDKSQRAFEVGANIAAYVTGLEPLADKLDVVRIVERDLRQSESPPRGALFIAQLMHQGDWRPDPRAIPNLADYLQANMSVDVVRGYQPLQATAAELAQHPIVYMTGHFSFKLSPQEVSALRKHIERGGFLFADACCGRQAFDASFRELAKALFPGQPLEVLPATHPIIAGQPGIPLGEVAYKPALRAEQPDLKQVRLEGITIAGRTAVVYSPYAIGCGLDGHKCHACRGLEPPDARRLAANIILYALSY